MRISMESHSRKLHVTAISNERARATKIWSRWSRAPKGVSVGGGIEKLATNAGIAKLLCDKGGRYLMGIVIGPQRFPAVDF
jgi:hypothetical protein